jgi:hypothetical protein
VNKKSIIIILLSIAMLATPFVATAQAFRWRRPTVTPVEITLSAGGYENFYDAWSIKDNFIIAKDLTTNPWDGSLSINDEDIPLCSIMSFDVLVNMGFNLEDYTGPAWTPTEGLWGGSVVHVTWMIEGKGTFEGRILFIFDYVSAMYWGVSPIPPYPFYDEWIPNAMLIECHYFGVLYGSDGQKLMLSGANVAGEYLSVLEGNLIER